MDAPENLIATRRDADIFEHGKGRGLRQSRNDRGRPGHWIGPLSATSNIRDDGKSHGPEDINNVQWIVLGATTLGTADFPAWPGYVSSNATPTCGQDEIL